MNDERFAGAEPKPNAKPTRVESHIIAEDFAYLNRRKMELPLRKRMVKLRKLEKEITGNNRENSQKDEKKR